MKSIFIFAIIVGFAFAAPANPDSEAQVVNYESNNIGVDSYNYGYQTSNGIQHSEEGQLKNVGTENEGIEVRGQYSYLGSDGVTYTVTYISNEAGFQPQGAHLPQA